MCRDTRKSRCRLAHGPHKAALALAVYDGKRATERRLNILGVRQLRLLLFKLLLLPLAQRQRINLLKLEAHKILVAAALFKLVAQPFEPRAHRPILVVQRPILTQLLIAAAQRIEHIQLKIPIAQQQILMLRVNIYERSAQLPELRHRYRCVVYECAAASRRRHLAPHDALALVVVEVACLEERLQIIPRKVEHPLDYAACSPLAHHFSIGALPQHHRDCTKKHRFSRSRLTGNNRKTIGKSNLKMVDKGKIIYFKRF